MRRSTIVVAILAATIASAEASPKSGRLASGASVSHKTQTVPANSSRQAVNSKQAVNAAQGGQVPSTAAVGVAAFTSARNANQTPAQPQTAEKQAVAQAKPAEPRKGQRVASRDGRAYAMGRQAARKLAARTPSAAPATTGSIPEPTEAPKDAAAAPAGSIPSMVTAEAKKAGVSPALAHAVVKVESRYAPNATGKGGYIGLMQLSYQTAKGMGFKGSRQALYQPGNNLTYGMRYLAEAVRLSGGNTCAAVSKYQGGHGVRGVTPAGSVYCAKVRRFMSEGVPAKAEKVASN